jgi:minor extracellular serine protease Vpr
VNRFTDWARGRSLSRRARLAGSVFAGVLLASVLTTVAAGSAATSEEGIATFARFANIDPTLYETTGGAQAKWVPAAMSTRRVTVMLQMNGKSVGDANAASGNKLTKAQKDAIRADLKGKQDNISDGIKKAGGDVVAQLQDAYNGVLVSAPLQSVPELAALPGVTAVQSIQTFQPSNEHGVPFINGPTAWGFGETGAGVNVASIDSGIDYTHANFGGPGTPAAYQDAFAHDTQAPNPSLVGAGAPKVKGGTDLVGDDYNASGSPAQQVPQPDPNPLDCNHGTTGGHGSHTAGTLAGFGVLDGSTFTGPYNATTVSSHAGHWTIGPGVAPQANIYAYRVFGCSGSSAVVAAAINDVVEHNNTSPASEKISVISMSLGSPFGGQNDPTSVASNTAVANGITVVASAGNSGPSGYVVGSPSTADGVLSVAAEDGTTPTFPGANVALSTGKSLQALDSNGATFSDGTNLPVVVVKDPTQPGGVSLGCSVAQFQAANVAGKLAVVQRGTCARVAKAIYGRDAGAAAVAMINNAAGFPPFEGPIKSNPDTGQAVPLVTIPFFGINGPITSTDAQNLVAADGGSATLTNAAVPNTNFSKVASFSSGGPATPDSTLKPEVIAPGVSVVSTGVGTGTDSATESGTSMSCPMTAGVAALLTEAHSTWTPMQIKAAIVDTVNPAKASNGNQRLIGNGTVDAAQALSTDVTATTPNGLDSFSFGLIATATPTSVSRTVTFRNGGTTSHTYNLTASTPTAGLGSIALSTSSFSLAPGGTQDVTATLSLSAAQVAALPSVDTFVLGPGGVQTLRGRITATPTDSSPKLLVPYIAAVRGLSNNVAGSHSAFVKQQTNNVFDATVNVANSGGHTGDVELYSWGIHDPQDTGLNEMDIRDVGVETIPASALVNNPAPGDSGLVFVVNNYGRASNASQNEFDIAIDTQNNGKPDFFVVGADLGFVLTGSFNGQYASFVVDAKTGNIVDAFLADAPTNSSTIELPALASDLGLHAANTSFHYSVFGFNDFPGSATVDATGSAAYDVANPGVSSGAFVGALAPGHSTTLSVSVDFDKFQSAPALGWLVVSLDDSTGAGQANEVPVGTIK